jgi:ribosomal protein L3
MDLRIIEHLVQLGTTPGRVLPGKKMAGQLGNKITTIQKLKVIQIDLEENILVIKDLFQENLVTY